MHFPDRLSEDAAHRLLARAVELDANHAGSLSIEQLRDVARDAGISPRAFEDALAEARAGTPKRSWKSWARSGVVNALGVGTFYYLFRSLNALLLPFPSTVVLMAIDILATLVGTAVALRLRGKIATAIIGIYAAAQIGSLVGLYGIYSRQSTQIFSLWGWASLGLASLCGVGLGALLMREHREPPLAAESRRLTAHGPETAPAENGGANVNAVRHLPFALTLGIHLPRADRAAAAV